MISELNYYLDQFNFNSIYTVSYVTLYFLGSIPFGLILTYLFGYGDIRKVGSGNIGTTNVLRTGNKFLALATLILDVLKGAIPALFIVLMRSVKVGEGPNPIFAPENHAHVYGLIFLFFVVLGHCFPIWLKFKGGKGVATALGGFLAAVPYAGLAACVAWLVTAFAFKYSSLAALVAMVVAPVVTFYVYGSVPTLICSLIILLVFWRHRQNIVRLVKGEESKISFKKKEERGGSVSE